MTQEDSKVHDSLIFCLKQTFGKLSPLTVHRGSVNYYLGMVTYFSQKRKVNVSMKEYVNRMLEECPTEFQCEAATPSAKNLLR